MKDSAVHPFGELELGGIDVDGDHVGAERGRNLHHREPDASTAVHRYPFAGADPRAIDHAVKCRHVAAAERRPRLSISPRGIRYARWGGAVVAWEEFAGYRRVSWRSLPHLQLIPRQASQLTQKFSMLGRLEQFCARLLRAPSFAIAVVPLEIDGVALEEEVRKYLPQSPRQA